MSMGNDVIETRKDADGKNKNKIFCTFCPSKILNAGVARLINMEFALPYVHCKGEGEGNQTESISDYWLIENMFTFENIGVSHTVDKVKYLACADCERGPVGWHDVSTRKSYIALCRVKHE
ncbi:PREDICTED: guanine nucleotide exchange factor MSS4 homolog [Dinoponera quadriceps]|uniref:Guanine nucleotide exchange factor MSS4 homolog n=1 Tax=Dinoponera quadriceps TaxID=609295 RepID=A0A6P3WZ30_DINQU|nr:PREDICTED: guanine nucleotide exchange factor MSS4 homolog [Dinoponera quadriceps]